MSAIVEESVHEIVEIIVKPNDFFRIDLQSPKTVIAPMVDASDLAFRMLCRKYGGDLAFTQMFNSNSFLTSKDYREQCFTTVPQDRPLIVQFCGHNPATLLAAAKYVEDRCDAIDINLGCPQDIARRGRYGAYLMEQLDLLREIVSTLSANLKVPVTCKTRIYKDFARSVRLCETLVDAGASMLTIHGRTRDEKGHKVQSADWAMIAKLKQHFQGRVPIVANGGIEVFDDVARCLEYTGADAVMTSEAILENPALLTDSRDPVTGEARNVLDLAEEYLALTRVYPVWSMKCVRSHIMKFLHRYFHVHTDLRVAAATAASVGELEDVCRKLRELVGEQHGKYTHSWYRRHRETGQGDDEEGCQGLQEGEDSVGTEREQSRCNGKGKSSLQRRIEASKGKLWEMVYAEGRGGDGSDSAEGADAIIEGGGGIFGAIDMFGSLEDE